MSNDSASVKRAGKLNISQSNGVINQNTGVFLLPDFQSALVDFTGVLVNADVTHAILTVRMLN